MKRKYSYIGLSLVILLFGIMFIPKIINAISKEEVVKADRLNIKGAEKEDNTSGAEELSYIEINGKKRKAPDFKLVNQHGDTITNKDYRGKVYVAEFFFTTCPTICPVMNQNLVEVQEEFKGNHEFGIASFSIDPKHDTPQVLKEYAENNQIDHPHWNLLTGEKEAIYSLANGGYNIYAGADSEVAGGFAHQGLFALVDKEGYLRSRQDDYGNPLIYYRGSIARNATVNPGEEEPQIEILMEDIKKLL